MFDVGPEITKEDILRYLMLKDLEEWQKKLLVESHSPVPSDLQPSGVLTTDD